MLMSVQKFRSVNLKKYGQIYSPKKVLLILIEVLKQNLGETLLRKSFVDSGFVFSPKFFQERCLNCSLKKQSEGAALKSSN